VKRIKHFVRKHIRRKREPLKQEVLFRLALEESGIDHAGCKIGIDHINGSCSINGIHFGIIYPKNFFEQGHALMTNEKQYKYYFNGFCDTAGGREELLAPFQPPEAVIVYSDDGRNAEKKKIFNTEYFEGLSKAEFGLCPHQLNWKGNRETMWTYRFIECCMVGAIPVVFDRTPLSEAFTQGIVFYTDSEVLGRDIAYSRETAEANYAAAYEKHTLGAQQIESIRATL